MNLIFRNTGKKEIHKLYIIKYRFKKATEDHPPYELGSAYYYEGWWVNFYNPDTFSEAYEVLGWCEYNF